MYDLKEGRSRAFDALGLEVPFADPPPAAGKPAPAAEHFAFAESPFAELEEPETEALAWRDLEADEQESAWRDEGGGEGEWLEEDEEEEEPRCSHCGLRAELEGEEQEEWLQEDYEGPEGQFERCAVQETSEDREETLLESEGWAPNPDQIDFQNRVLAAHIKRTKARRGPPLPDLSDNQLAIIPGSAVKSKIATAAAAGRMLAAANSDLALAQANGDPDALKIKRLFANSGYRSSDHQRKLWLGYFPKYYKRTRAVREEFAEGRHSDRARDHMLDPKGFGLGGRIAAPGYSNHQNGIAVDLRQELANGKFIANDSDSASRSIWRKTWFHKWLKANAATYGFLPLASEEWHWEYKPVPAASAAAPLPAAIPASPTIPATQPLVLRPDEIVRIANQEFDRWHPPGGDLVETDVAATPILQQYYRDYRDGVRPEKTAAQLQSPAWHNSDEGSWSAVFISWVMRTAGAGIGFEYSVAHRVYIGAAKRNRLQNNAASPFWAYRATEVAPQVGDIVCKSRGRRITTYNNVDDGTRPLRGTHGDIVTEVREGSISVVGGNVGNVGNVDRRELNTLPDGRLSLAGGQAVYFAVVRCRGAANVLQATPEAWEEQDSYEGTDEWENEANEAEWGTTSAQSEIDDQATRTTPRDHLGGKVWLHSARTGKLKVAVFVPAGARSQQSVDVLLYVHGLLSPCGKPGVVPEGLITGGQFQLAQSVSAASRPTILIVPLFQEGNDTSWNAHGLGKPANLNAFIAEMLLEIGSKNGAPPPAIGNLIVAGHSKAYDVLYPLARAHRDPAMATGALARLAAIWALDASYGTFPEQDFEALLKAKPGLTVQAIYRKGKSSKTDKFNGRARSGRLTLRPLEAAFVCHCAVPGHVLPGLLASLSSQTPANEDTTFESDLEDFADEDEIGDEAFEGEYEADAELDEMLGELEGLDEEREAEGEYQPLFEGQVAPEPDIRQDFSLKDIASGKLGAIPDAFRAEILSGKNHNLNDLANRLFWEMFPQLANQRLDPKNPSHRKLVIQYRRTARHIKALIWLHMITKLIDLYRGDLPREYLLGWIAHESDGIVSTVTSLGERGYFQIHPAEAKDQLRLSSIDFRSLSQDRSVSIREGIRLVQAHRKNLVDSFKITDLSELHLRLVKARHGLPNLLKSTLEEIVRDGKTIEWGLVAAKMQAKRDRGVIANVNATMELADKLKPLSDLVPQTDDEAELEGAELYASDWGAFESGRDNLEVESATHFADTEHGFEAETLLLYETEDKAEQGFEGQALDPALSSLAERVMSRETPLIEYENPKRWTRCFAQATIDKLVQGYKDNQAAADANRIDRNSCIVMLNVGLGQLLDIILKESRARGVSDRRVRMANLPTESIQAAMKSLQKGGFALPPKRFEFYDRRKQTAETLKPETLKLSVLQYVLALSKAEGCWFAFGLSIMDGYHSVLLLVHRRPDGARVYWLDQFSAGLTVDVTNTLDDVLNERTKTFWQGVMDSKNKGYNTTIQLWPL